ncbi:solute carrier family 26 member 6-like [Synchiropus picturatus]
MPDADSSPPAKYFVQRQVFDELSFEEAARKGNWSSKPSIRERLTDTFKCSLPRVKQTILSTVPVLGWLPKYSIRENAIGDLVSGCSVGIMHLPQGMAYALLASLPPVYGLYSSLFPVLIYFIFGTSRHISIGTFAVASVMIGSVTERLAPDSDFISPGNVTNSTGEINIAERDAYRVRIASSVAVLSGLFQILLGLVKSGFVVNYLSEPLIRGYTTGSACHVCLSQIKYIFGLNPSRANGPLSLLYTFLNICWLLPQTKAPEVVVSVLSLTVLIAVKELSACYAHKLPMPIPIELFVIVVATIITHFGGLADTYDIDVVGEIPSGLKPPRAPDMSLFSEVIGDAIALAIVCYAINISLGKTFGLKYGYKVDSNQELIALGLSNAIGGCFQCYTVTSSLSRSLVQESTGGKTQVAGLVSSVIVLVTILKIGSLFENLPKAVLAAVVFVNLKGIFKQFTDVPKLWKTNKMELLVWLLTFMSTILLNLDLGLVVSVIGCMLIFIFRTQMPRYSILGEVKGTGVYVDVDLYKEAREIPGIKIFRSSTTIYYTNAEMYLEALEEKSGIQIEKLLKAKKREEKKMKRLQEKRKKKAKKDAKKLKKNPLNGALTMKDAVSLDMDRYSQASDSATGHKSVNGHVNAAYQHDAVASDSDSNTGVSSNQILEHQTEDGEDSVYKCDTHSIILDLSTTSFVDTAAVKTLKITFMDFAEINVDVYLAGCQACVVDQLEAAGFFSETIPKTRLFVSIHDAVVHILMKHSDLILDGCSTKM